MSNIQEEINECGTADAFDEADFAILYREAHDSGTTTMQEITNVPQDFCREIARRLRPVPAEQPPTTGADYIVKTINHLREEEGDSVTILCDNPEGPPNVAIECNGAWTGWQDRRFVGADLIEALSAAYLQCVQLRAAADYGKKWGEDTTRRSPAVKCEKPSSGFDKWFDRTFLDPDGGSKHLPDWFRGDMLQAWEEARKSRSQPESFWKPIETAPCGERILLCWNAASGIQAHVELGKRSTGDIYTNTYGKPFSGSPDRWMPLPSTERQEAK